MLMHAGLRPTEIVVDNFCGAGGASLGLWLAFGRSPEVAVNHNKVAIAVHSAEHPETEHYIEDVWSIDPVEACGGRPVGEAWFSPDCTDFSRAKGSKPDRPKSAKRRALAGVVCRWAKRVRPRVIHVENVQEFLGWGPLGADGQRDPARVGMYFRRWIATMERLGYVWEHRILRACDYGVPTTRERLFFTFRCDGQPIGWPEPTHGPAGSGLLPYVSAASCINFALPCPSIFMTAAEAKALGLRCKRPLADATLARIARGFQRHVVERIEAGGTPYVVDEVTCAAGTTRYMGAELAAALLIQTGYGERKEKPGCKAQKTRVLDIEQPLGTIVSCGIKHAVACAYLVKNNGGHEGHGQSVEAPMDAITTRDSKSLAVASLIKLRGTSTSADPAAPLDTVSAGGTHHGAVTYQLVREDSLTEAQLVGAKRVYSFLMKYNGTQQYPLIEGPMPTITTTEGIALITVACVRLADGDYIVVDIGMRMLTPAELARAQGFPPDYDVSLGGTLTAEEQVMLIGNSVCPPLARALAEANHGRRSVVTVLRSKHTRGAHMDVNFTTDGAASSRPLN